MADIFIAASARDTALETPEERIQQRCPRTTSETLACMRQQLEHFYLCKDSRAIFLRAYYLMTTEVRAAIHGEGDYTLPIFFDGKWVDEVVARFSGLYFSSLAAPACEAWKRAHALAGEEHSSVIENLMLGINAHINYDLAFGVHALLREGGEYLDPERLARRRFDHDQINNVLMRCLPKIQAVLVREFGGGIRIFSDLFGKLDELVSFTGLRAYRDRVWHNVLALLSARTLEERQKVEKRLDWESLQIAEVISQGSALNRVVWRVDGHLRSWRYETPLLEERAGGIHALRATHHRLQRPF
ncbi:DUF5995 family protein [Stigmatella aurantiaca]|uniref:Conserved uncharacterized protein n=1 Tax=Stigmatella aurantiaca (strain DW4/3-1) TaxID=378806 RepID=Q08VF9_STIAD|nr:DUF5995 family protein [Stigmatella aurantiaca]ADO72169.1 conserved uncharacterized protein [Stigmatella aurantiaca DW4/3-1]EAU64479.1 conserved hypothetical protein [Stigmatella aurantiaca DW4/3-1]